MLARNCWDSLVLWGVWLHSVKKMGCFMGIVAEYLGSHHPRLFKLSKIINYANMDCLKHFNWILGGGFG
jgi:hypothetical protein